MSRSLRTSAPLAGLALVLSLNAAVRADQAAAAKPSTAEHEPTQWLERMNAALTTRNYDGTFSHVHGGRVDTLRIIHRVQNGVVSERLVSLDGSGREFIRTGPSLACYLPDRRTVLVEEHTGDQPLVGIHFPAVNDQTETYYNIRESGHTRINQRDTHIIEVTPKDNFRYGYRLWIDGSTAMPVRTELCDAQGRVIEQVEFASLTVKAHIPDSAFKPDVATEGFQWLRNSPAQRSPAPPANSLAWNAMRLPPGFRMMVRSAQLLPGASGPVDHLVFTDGFASVSVFVEVQQPGAAAQPSAPQAATVGSSSAFSTFIDGHKVTAVGEVPPETVQFIATQVKAAGAAAGPPPGGH
jgi:sigma-E factor negative regulatory protein RseB